MSILDDLRALPIGGTIVVTDDDLMYQTLHTVLVLRTFGPGVWRKVAREKQATFAMRLTEGDPIMLFRFVGNAVPQ